jgi:hypothetical protein
VNEERPSLLPARSCDLGGWVVVICPGCGTTVNEWFPVDHDPGDRVEYEECPMCVEASRDEECWS